MTSGNVYLARAGTSGPIKVGWTSGSVMNRLAALQTGSPEPIAVLASIEAAPETEKLIHSAYRRSRRLGEWFHPTPELLALVERITAATELCGEQRDQALREIVDDLRTSIAIAEKQELASRISAGAIRDIDVRAIRKRLGLSQLEFALQFGFTAARIRDWEQRRSRPDGALRAYLIVIDRNPQAVRDALRAI